MFALFAQYCKIVGSRGFEWHLPSPARRSHCKKARIFDGDDGLVGEGGDQLNLLVGEGPYRVSPQGDYANRPSFSQERNAKDRAKAAKLLGFARVFGIGQNVGDVSDFAFKQ